MGSGKELTVCHVITRLDKGGSAESTHITVVGLDKRRYHVVLIKGLGLEFAMSHLENESVTRDLQFAEDAGVKIITLPELVREIRPLQDLIAGIKLYRLFRHLRPDIVHTHTSKAGVLGRWAAFFAGVPRIIHTPHGHVFWGYFGKIRTRFYILVERLTTMFTDWIVALTDKEGADYIRYKVAPAEKVITIHSGVDLEKMGTTSVHSEKVRSALEIGENQVVVGTIGRLTSIKGHKYLVEAAQKIVASVSQVVFLIVGDGSLRKALEDQVKQLSLSSYFRFTGWRPDIPEMLSIMDIFVLPSLNEGMGRVLVEAMAVGKPVVGSNVGGIPTLISHGQNGLVVMPRDAEDLARALTELIKDQSLRERFGNSGRTMAKAFGVKAMVDKIEMLYQQVGIR